ncbi:MAG: hypothetical protein BJ554DRAFT_7595 [Olpidium bornovanus]|uniref:Uncharacterized protein n=1 Tax=Olpidium bornovanus TaxID=278681 RepID=A0A8H7ZVU4_9FUNG|nr:MAG: hypothetical protein BJ554DRAFT_7595 [Olpidium bornovanus]
MANAVADAIRPLLDGVASVLRALTGGLQGGGLASAGDAAAGPAAGAAASGASAAVARRGRSPAPALATGLALVGAATAVSWALSAAKFLYPHVRPSRLRRFHHGGPHRPWAVVTGASDGIGKAFAYELAAACFNVVLVARDRDKLALTARGIEYDFPGTMVRVVVTNAGSLDQTDFLAELDAAVAALPGPLTVLVNNVGRISAVEALSAQDDYDLADIVAVNDVFPTLITKRLLPTLVKNQPSLILNVGSVLSELAPPYLGVYSGTKVGTP